MFRNKMIKTAGLLLTAILALSALSGCNSHDYADSDTAILDAQKAVQYINDPSAVFVDMQDAAAYAEEHVPGAVNISLSDIVVNVPVENTLASKNKIEKLMGANGISNDKKIIVYDGTADSLYSSRFWYTMLVYGATDVQVVSGGFDALKRAGAELTADKASPQEANYVAGDKNEAIYATLKDIRAQLDNPDPGVVLLDARTNDEYMETGKIPTAVIIPHTSNFYTDGTFKNTQTTRINYLNAGIFPEQKVIIYCRTGVRASVTFLSLYDAGYRDLMLYDGSFAEWSANPDNPLELPDNAKVQSSVHDNS